MTGGRPAEPVRVLADVSEAQGLGPRARAMKYTSLVPLNRFVDAARPESETVARAWSLPPRGLIKDRADKRDEAFLREQFTRWAANDARFQRSGRGQRAAGRGEAALEGSRGARRWRGCGCWTRSRADRSRRRRGSRQQKAEMTRLAKPQAEVILAAYRPVKVLLDAAQ